MPTRYSEEWASPTWTYPMDVPGFLKSLGTSLGDPKESRTRVEIFMILPVARKMPNQLRQQLIEAGVLDPSARPGYVPQRKTDAS